MRLRSRYTPPPPIFVQVQYHLPLTHWISVLNNGRKERGSEGRHEKEGEKSAQIPGSSFGRGNFGRNSEPFVFCRHPSGIHTLFWTVHLVTEAVINVW